MSGAARSIRPAGRKDLGDGSFHHTLRDIGVDLFALGELQTCLPRPPGFSRTQSRDMFAQHGSYPITVRGCLGTGLGMAWLAHIWGPSSESTTSQRNKCPDYYSFLFKPLPRSCVTPSGMRYYNWRSAGCWRGPTNPVNNVFLRLINGRSLSFLTPQVFFEQTCESSHSSFS